LHDSEIISLNVLASCLTKREREKRTNLHIPQNNKGKRKVEYEPQENRRLTAGRQQFRTSLFFSFSP